MLKYFISTYFLCCFFIGQAQQKPIDLQPKDSVIYKQKYGLRAGVDLSRILISNLDDDYTGFEIVGDYRISQKYFLAAELGNEKRTRQEELSTDQNIYNFNTSGSYIKLGVDYNTYANWYGEQNSIYIGGRYAYSTFSQTVNNFQYFDRNRYWNPDGFVEGSDEAREITDLSASWLEFIFGIKAELFANIYIGGSIRLGFIISEKEPENFKNLYIPGFNKVTDDSNFGVGYNVSLSYFIPFYKKEKKPKKSKKEVVKEQ